MGKSSAYPVLKTVAHYIYNPCIIHRYLLFKCKDFAKIKGFVLSIMTD
jgi:hypothetical protein